MESSLQIQKNNDDELKMHYFKAAFFVLYLALLNWILDNARLRCENIKVAKRN